MVFRFPMWSVLLGRLALLTLLEAQPNRSKKNQRTPQPNELQAQAVCSSDPSQPPKCSSEVPQGTTLLRRKHVLKLHMEQPSRTWENKQQYSVQKGEQHPTEHGQLPPCSGQNVLRNWAIPQNTVNMVLSLWRCPLGCPLGGIST